MLSFLPTHLSLPKPISALVSLEQEVYPWLDQSLNETMVLFDEVIEICVLPQFRGTRWSALCFLLHGRTPLTHLCPSHRSYVPVMSRLPFSSGCASQIRCIALYPIGDSHVVNRESSFSHEFFEDAGAESRAQIHSSTD